MAESSRGVAQQFGDAQNRGERIIELVGDAGNHLAHGRRALSVWISCCSMRLVSVISRAEAMTPAMLTGSVQQGAGGGAEQAHLAVVALGQIFDAALGALCRQAMESNSARTSLRSCGSMRSPTGVPIISSGEKPSSSLERGLTNV